MNRLSRVIGLAGAAGALMASLTAGSVFAAGSSTIGHVYVNNNSAGHNTIAGFDRHRNGSLTPIPGSPFAAGGAGTGAPFGSAGGLQETADGRYLLATDPGSNEISVLRIKHNGSLQLVDVEDSNGSLPTSIAVHDRLVYVANGGAGGSNYTGFRLDAGGHLRPIPGSTYALPDDALPDDALPGHVLISPDGRRLVGHTRRPERRPVVPRRIPYRPQRSADGRAGLAVPRPEDRPVRQHVLADPRQPAVRLECPRRRGQWLRVGL